MKLSLFSRYISVLFSLALTTNAFASLSIESPYSAFVIDFTGFDGSGFSPEPEPGQLDSDMWVVDGLSDGSFDFGETALSDDFARGSDPDAVSTGGIYAFDTGNENIALGIQPGGSDWTPGSFTLRLQNNTGQALDSLELSYSIFVYNDGDRASSFNFSYSSDNNTYTDVSIFDFESPKAKDNSPIWAETQLSTTLSGLSINDGENYYLSWSGDDFSGTGGRDQFALDNISITAVPETKYFGLICGLIVLFVIKKRICSFKV